MILYQQFSVDGDDYLYDTASNAIIRLPGRVTAELSKVLSSNSISDVSGYDDPNRQYAADFVNRAQQRNGLLVPRPARNYRGILDSERIRTQIDRGMRGLLLGVTDQCNQRCSYCIYSGNYVGSRTHGTKRMSWDVARRSIDMFVAHRSEASPTFITFYGGEPLAAWDLVRRCTTYLKDKVVPDLGVVMNTNLTLLTKTRAEFLAEHEVGLVVSIDGPAPIHDSARRFVSGKPTHARVVQWLEYLREQYPSYWREHVVLQATYNRNSDLETVVDYFCDEMWCDLPNSITGIRVADQSDLHYTEATNLRHVTALDDLVFRRMRALESGEPFAHRLFADMFQTVCKDIPAREIGYAFADAHPMQTCIPGVARLYVDPSGTFYPCEKTDVPGTSIGDIDNGIDLRRVRHLLTRQVKYCEAECDKCWALRLCSVCLTHFLERGQVRWRRARKSCERERERIRQSLIRFVHIYNNEPRSTWDHPFSLHRAVEKAKRS